MSDEGRKAAKEIAAGGERRGQEGKGHDIIVIGASMGGIPALRQVIKDLPGDLEASVFVVQHTSPYSRNYLVDILGRDSALLVRLAIDGEDIRRGRVYIAPSDRHLMVRDSLVQVVYGPRENHTRPSIDPLFRSAAVNYGPRVVGVILSGMLDDGTSGMIAVHRCGGEGIVQEPDEAEYPEMPASAINFDHPDYRLSLSDIGPKLVELTHTAPGPVIPIPPDIIQELLYLQNFQDDLPQIGVPVEVTCPECGGPLRLLVEGEHTRYRCHVGHAYTAKSLLHNQRDDLERLSWAMFRLLTQRRKVLSGMVEKARAQGRRRLAADYEDRLARVNTMSELAQEILRLSEGR